ncbi:hypothetical protein HK405_012104 [Cladochytrium tenue]|nr:hypothetical protein HK405_012104 [Cladochytrium tenue]
MAVCSLCRFSRSTTRLRASASAASFSRRCSADKAAATSRSHSQAAAQPLALEGINGQASALQGATLGLAEPILLACLKPLRRMRGSKLVLDRARGLALAVAVAVASRGSQCGVVVSVGSWSPTECRINRSSFPFT